MKFNFKEKLYYLKRSFFHPFDAFYEIRFRDKGSTLLAAILLAMFGIVQCISYQYTGFVMNTNEINAMNSLSIFFTWVLGFILFVVSNWSITTLFNGKGGITDILQVVGYSLTPLTLTTLVQVFLSNFVIEEEVMIVQVITAIGAVWFLFMLVSGLCVVHEYGFGKNILAILFSFVAAAVIIFLGVLFFTLIEQMVLFIISVAQEFIRRL